MITQNISGKKDCFGSKQIKLPLSKRFVLLLLIMCFNGYAAISQELIIERDTISEARLCTVGKEDACVIIIAAKSLQLAFESSVDDELNLLQSEVGASIHYRFGFPTVLYVEGGNGDKQVYKTRILTISSPHIPVPVDLALSLTAKETRTYIVKAPECYSKAYKEALDLFRKGLYIESQEKYRQARKCFDVPLDENTAQKITIIDSILLLKKIADNYLENLDYDNAMDNYQKILAYNQEDAAVVRRYTECVTMKDQLCIKYFSEAEKCFEAKDNQRAEELYEMVRSKRCATYYYEKSEEKLKLLWKQKYTTTILSYEWAKTVPIGLSIGGYKQMAAGAYFTIQTNTDMFEALRSNYEKVKKPEIDVSVGWTFRPFKKYIPKSTVWMFLGPGYTGVGEYVYNEENTSEKPKLNFYHAVSPEVGLLVKLGPIPIALRYTFQYRFAFKKEQEEYIGRYQHILGIGYCF